jgi:hypothetical protein
MSPETVHLSDVELLRLMDGEITEVEAMRARGHLSECEGCQSSLLLLESTGVELAQHLHLSSLHIQPGAREQLRAKLRAASATPWWKKLIPGTFPLLWAGAASVLVIAAFAISQHGRLGKTANIYLAAQAEPNSRLTPGATRDVRLADICQSDDNDFDPAVPSPIQQAVFSEYGMNDVPARDYQVDYLINPQLGGTNDIQNLWPQPYNTIWNARVKDALEDRLHQMVCKQQIDLASAQHDIASDWIAAYKKYFHTSYPL